MAFFLLSGGRATLIEQQIDFVAYNFIKSHASRINLTSFDLYVVPAVGIEPTANSLEGYCSIH